MQFRQSVIHQSWVTTDAQQVRSRRDFLKRASLAGAAAGLCSWTDLVGVKAEELRASGHACILLWMQGGPSQFETFSPKPDHDNGAGTQVIATSVPGIQIAAGLPRLAERMQHLAIVRSMTSKEGNHARASYLLHTGYLPTGSIKHPTFGSLVAQQIGQAECELPSFVRVGGKQRFGAGFLGVDFDPFALADAEAVPQNTRPATSLERYQRRLGLLDRLETDYAQTTAAREVVDHRKVYQKSVKMILSPQMKAFDLSHEDEATREAYGRTKFGAGCLLARRLVEAGVSFVEVDLGNWDTHFDNAARTTELTAQLDQPFAALLDDLSRRGMLEKTLVIWMGEFGRTPRINPRAGRDHYPKAFNVVLAGGGVQGGRVIGQTDAGGTEVTERPVTIADLFQTFCRSLAIDAGVENMSGIGRPIKIVDGGQAINELFS